MENPTPSPAEATAGDSLPSDAAPATVVEQDAAAEEKKADKPDKPAKAPKAEASALVKECRILAAAAKLSPDDTEALLLAAWFHDTGYLDVYDGHEFRSVERAVAWLTEQKTEPGRIQLIKDLIKATHRDEEPGTELQELLVDADMSNLAADDFRSTAELLRTEWELVLGKTYTNPEWADLQLAFMAAHKYHSEVGKERYRKQFKANLKEQRDQLKKIEKKAKKKAEELNGTFADPKRGVETMFRSM